MPEPTIEYGYLGDSREDAIDNSEPFTADDFQVILDETLARDPRLKDAHGQSRLFCAECPSDCPTEGRLNWAKETRNQWGTTVCSNFRRQQVCDDCPAGPRQEGDGYISHEIKQRLVIDPNGNVIEIVGHMPPASPEFEDQSNLNRFKRQLYQNLRTAIDGSSIVELNPMQNQENPMGAITRFNIGSGQENILRRFESYIGNGSKHKIIFRGFRQSTKVRYFIVEESERKDRRYCSERIASQDVVSLPARLRRLKVWLPEQCATALNEHLGTPDLFEEGLRTWLEKCDFQNNSMSFEGGILLDIRYRYLYQNNGLQYLKELVDFVQSRTGGPTVPIRFRWTKFDLSVMVDQNDLTPNCDDSFFSTPGDIASIYADRTGVATICIDVQKKKEERKCYIWESSNAKHDHFVKSDAVDPLIWFTISVTRPKRIRIRSSASRGAGHIDVHVYPGTNTALSSGEKKKRILESNLDSVLNEINLEKSIFDKCDTRSAVLREIIHASYQKFKDEQDSAISISGWSSKIRRAWIIIQRLRWPDDTPVLLDTGLGQQYLSRMPEYALLPKDGDRGRAVDWIGLSDRIEELPDGNLLLHSCKPTSDLPPEMGIEYTSTGSRIVTGETDGILRTDLPLLSTIAPSPEAWLNHLIKGIDSAGGWKDQLSLFGIGGGFQFGVYRWNGTNTYSSLGVGAFNRLCDRIARGGFDMHYNFHPNRTIDRAGGKLGHEWKRTREKCSGIVKMKIDSRERFFALEFRVNNRSTGYRRQQESDWGLFLVELLGDNPNEDYRIAHLGSMGGVLPEWLPDQLFIENNEGILDFRFIAPHSSMELSDTSYMSRETMRAFSCIHMRHNSLPLEDTDIGYRGIPAAMFENLGLKYVEKENVATKLGPIYAFLSDGAKKELQKNILKRCWWLNEN